MKVVPPKNDNGNANGKSKTAPHLLSLEEDEGLYYLDKTNSVSWELYTVPGDTTSPKYKFQVRVLQGDETPRQMIRWRLDVIKVCTGLDVTTLTTRKPVMEVCMRAGPKANFESALGACATKAYNTALVAAEAVDVTAGDTVASDAVKAHGVNHYRHFDHLATALGLVVNNLLPRKILARVKRTMRRDMRKPQGMKVRTYYQNLLRLNGEELPNLPPFGPNQSLSNDELLDIVLFGTPRSWQNEMERQGFDPMEQQLFQVIDIMENIETTETNPMTKVTGKSDGKKPAKGKDSKDSSSKKKAPYFCKEHGPNYTHDTKDCKVLQKKGSGNNQGGNKSWNRKASESSAKSKKELATLIAKTVTKNVKKQLASADKKRKSDDSSDDDDKDCFLVQELTKDLEGFNYREMDDMSTASESDKKDEISDEISL